MTAALYPDRHFAAAVGPATAARSAEPAAPAAANAAASAKMANALVTAADPTPWRADAHGDGSMKSLRQESNPHLGRTKGACLPLTLRRQRDFWSPERVPPSRKARAPRHGRARAARTELCRRPRRAREAVRGAMETAGLEPAPARCKREVLSEEHVRRLMRTDGVESPLPRLQRGELAVRSASAREGDRPDSNRRLEAHNLGCLPLHHGHQERGRPGSNRRPLA